MIGYRDMFLQIATNPMKDTLTVKLWVAKKEAWLQKQESVYAIINNRLGYNGREAVKIFSTMAEIIAKIETRFCVSGSKVFIALHGKYNKLSLGNCNKVLNFVEKVCQAKNNLLELDVSCKIGKPHIIHKLLSILDPSFNIFSVNFSQTYYLLPIITADRIVSIVAITFEKTIIVIVKKEQKLKQHLPESAKVILIS